MGIIQKQALRTTLITFGGIAVGVVSRFTMPLILSKEEVGVLALLDSISAMVSIVFCLGFAQISYRIFPKFRNEENGNSGFLFLGLIFSFTGIVLGWTTFYFLQDLFLGENINSELIRSLAYLIFPMVFFRIIFRNMDVYLRMHFKSVTGAFLEGFLLKLIILISLIIFWLNYIDYNKLVYLYVLAFCVPGFFILFAAFYNTKKIVLPQPELYQKENRRAMFNYGSFGILAAASGVIILSIDQIMLNRILGTEAVGVYSVMFFAGVLINVPSRGIKRIAAPVIAESWRKNDLKEINTIYKKSALNQLLLGLYLFIVGWACIEPALTFIPQYASGIYVFFFIGIGQLIEMMTGLNNEIIATSSKYKMNTYFNIVLAILIIILNYYFIDLWGLTGAAAASALAMLVVNTARWLYLIKAFKLQPFTLSFFKILLIGSVLFISVELTTFNINPIPKMLIYFFSISIIYWGIILKLNLSEDVNNWLKKMKNIFL